MPLSSLSLSLPPWLPLIPDLMAKSRLMACSVSCFLSGLWTLPYASASSLLYTHDKSFPLNHAFEWPCHCQQLIRNDLSKGNFLVEALEAEKPKLTVGRFSLLRLPSLLGKWLSLYHVSNRSKPLFLYSHQPD